MLDRIREFLTGADDLERLAAKNDLASLNAYLKQRPVFVPQRPKRFLDASSFTNEELVDLMRCDSEQLASSEFEPWILESDGRKRLPIFSSEERMQAFANRVSQDMKKVFGLGCISVLLAEVTEHVEIDVVELNPFSRRSWEISAGASRSTKT